MIKKDKFFFFGFGQTAKYLVNNLIKSKKKFTLCATNTQKTTLKTFMKNSILRFLNAIFINEQIHGTCHQIHGTSYKFVDLWTKRKRQI